MRVSSLNFRGAGLAAAMALAASAGWTMASSPVTVPSSVGAAEGNSDNMFPLNGAPMRYQQVISSSEFAAGGPRWITGIALRPDGVSGVPFSETLTDVQINLSTTPATPAGLSKTFASNVGGDDTIVYSGALALASACSGPSGGPYVFDIAVTLQKPFYYDPSAGNLLLDVRNRSGGKTTQLDAQDAPDSTARVWSDDVNSATATGSDPYPSVGLVLQFSSN